MSEEEIPSFRRSHDPDDTASRNFRIGGLLRRVSGTVQDVTVTVAEGPDSLLLVSDVIYDVTTHRVSFRITGGTRGARYRIQVRILLTDTRRYDASAWQAVRDH